ncbi:MAG: class II aldolase/adducin family protein [Streptosporangiaceae bacterium]
MTAAAGLPEPEARALIAAACRVLQAAGQGDMVWGHVSVRDADGRGLWLKGAGLGFDEVTEADCVLLSWSGEILAGTAGRHVEYPIHTELMAARPDIGGVVHTHPLYSVAFAAQGRPLRALSHEGAQFVPPDIPRFTRTGDLINTAGLGHDLAQVLGAGRAVLMPRHGIVTVATALGDAVGAAVHLERACQLELLAGPGAEGSSAEEAAGKRNRARNRFRTAWEYLERTSRGT